MKHPFSVRQRPYLRRVTLLDRQWVVPADNPYKHVRAIAIYARSAREEPQHVFSHVSTQISELVAVCRSVGAAVAATFTDPATGDLSLDRPGMRALLKAAAVRPRGFNAVLVRDTARLSRNAIDVAILIERLGKLGVAVVIPNNGDAPPKSSRNFRRVPQ